MPFVTKLDYSNNRQIKQFKYTETQLSGKTDFGVHYSALTGADISSLVVIESVSGITSTFSGNTTTTVLSFGDPRMSVAASGLYTITNVNSGDTQVVVGYEGKDSTIIDGNTVYSSYTGATYDLSVSSISEVGVNQWTGETITNTLVILSGGSLDFSDRTIWVDVLGITRTKRLILSDELEFRTGDTVTILGRDSQGNVVGVELSGITGTTGGDIDTNDYTTGATFNTINGVVTFTRLSGGTYDVDIDGRYLPISGFTAYTGSTQALTDNDDYTTGATFNTNNGIITYTRLSGGTYDVDIDGRYLPISGFTAYTGSTQALTDNDDYTVSASFSASTGNLGFTRLSGGTYNVNLDGRYLQTADYVDNDNYLIGGTFDPINDIIDFDMASGNTVSVYIGGRYVTFDNLITGVTVTGGITKTITLTNKTGGTISDTWTDLTASGGTGGNVVTGMTFNINNGILTLYTLSGDTISEDLDGRYLPLSAQTDDYTTGATFNPSNGIITYTRLSGGTYTVDISPYSGSASNDNYVTGFTYTASANTLTIERNNGLPDLSTTITEFSGLTITNSLSATTIYSGDTNLTDVFVIDTRINNVILNGDYVWISGYTYEFWADLYYINGVKYDTYTSAIITLEPSDPVLDRFDLVVINDTGVIEALSGTPATYPSPPISDSDTQVDFVAILVEANTSQPAGVFDVLVYDENTQIVGGEWDTSIQGGNVILSATSDSYSGVTSILFTGASINDGAIFDTDVPLNGYDVASLYFRIKLLNAVAHKFTVQLLNITGSTGDIVTIQNGVYGLDTSVLNTWQLIVVPIADLGVSTINYNELQLINKRNGASFYVDRIILQNGLPVYNQTIITRTSQLINDGEDGDNPFISALDLTDDYTTGATFNINNGIVTFTRLSGGTFDVDLDGRYLTLSASTGLSDDYTVSASYTGVTGSGSTLEFTRLSGGTYDVNLGFEYSSFVSGFTFGSPIDKLIITGDLELQASDTPGFEYTFPDISGIVALKRDINYLTGATFNSGNGVLSLDMWTGNTFNVDLDGRYLPTSAYTNTFTGLTDTPSTYSGQAYNLVGVNSGETGLQYFQAVLKAENQGNGTGYAWANRDESKYTNIGNAALDLSFVASPGSDYGVGSPLGFAHGQDHRLPITGGTSGNFGGHFTFGYGNQIEGYYGNAAIGAYNTVLDGYNALTIGYSNYMNMTATVGHGFSVGGFNNSTSYWNNAFGFDLIVKSKGTTVVGLSNTDYTISAATDPTRPVFVVGAGNAVSSAGPTYGDNIFRADAFMVRFNGEITAPITSINDINNAGGKSLITLEYLTGYTASGGTGSGDDYTTGATFNTNNGLITFTRLSGGTYDVDIDNRYLTLSAFTSYTGSTTGTDDYTISAGFTASTGHLEFTRISGGTYDVFFGYEFDTVLSGWTFGNTGNTLTILGDLQLEASATPGFEYTFPDISGEVALVRDINYLTGATFDNTNGIISLGMFTGNTITVDIDDRYLTLSAFTSYTGSTTGTDDYTTGATFNTNNGIITYTRISGGTYNVDIDGRYLTLSAFTSYTGSTAGTDDFTTGATFDNTNGIITFTRISGGTYNVDLDGRYLPTSAYTDTNIFVSGGTFDSTNGIITYTNTSGGTFNVDIDGRYLTLSAFTSYTGATVDNNDYTTGATFNTSNGIVTFTRLSGGTYDVDLDGRYVPLTASTGNAALIYSPTGNTSGIYKSGRTESNYGGVGIQSVDLTFSNTLSTTNGVTGDYSLGGGYQNVISGNYAFGVGWGNTADSLYSVVVGAGNLAGDSYAFAGGQDNVSTGIWSFAYGLTNFALGNESVVMGAQNTGTTAASIAIGRLNYSSGQYAVAMGFGNEARHNVAIALGDGNLVTGQSAAAIGGNLLSRSAQEVSVGMYNTDYTAGSTINWIATDRIFNIGIGVNSGSRADGLTMLKDGTLYLPPYSGGTFTGTPIYNLSIDSTGKVITADVTTGGSDDYTISASFDNTNGIITYTRLSGGTYSVDIDGRYLPTSAYTDTNIFVSGATFNTSNGLLEFTNTSGGTFNVDIDGRYLPTSAYTDTNIFVSGATFNTTNGILEFTNTSGGTFNIDLDGRYSYLSGGTGTNTDDFTTGATFTASTGIMEFTRQSGATYSVALGYQFNTVLSGWTFGNTADTLTILGDLQLEASATPGFEYTFPDISGEVALVRDINYLTGATFNTSNGLLNLGMLTGNTITTDLDGRYLTFSAFTSYTGSTTGTDDFTTGATFNSSNGLITFTRQSGSTYSVDIGAYSGTTPNLQQVTDVGNITTNEVRAAAFIASSGGTGGSQSFVANTPNSNASAVMAVGGGIEFGYLSLRHQDNNRIQTINMKSNPTVSGTSIYYLPDRTGSYTQPIVFTDGSTTVSADTFGLVNLSPLGLGGGTDDYTISASFDNTNGIITHTRLSGGTYTVDIDGRYLTLSAFTSYTGSTTGTDDYVTGATFDTSTGDLNLTRQSGGTVTVNLDNRYQPIHIDVNQTSHGFSIGDAVRFDGSTWTLALADSPSHSSALGLVSKSADTNNFSVQTSGVFTGSTWTSGVDYFLSTTVSGSVVTEPTYLYNQVRQYIGTALSTSQLLLAIDLGDEIVEFLDNYRENTVGTTHNIDWYYETHRITLTADTTFTDSNLPTSGIYSKAITLYVDGDFNLTLPTAWQTYVTGTYDGLTLNQIVVEYIKSGLYWVDINRAD